MRLLFYTLVTGIVILWLFLIFQPKKVVKVATVVVKPPVTIQKAPEAKAKYMLKVGNTVRIYGFKSHGECEAAAKKFFPTNRSKCETY